MLLSVEQGFWVEGKMEITRRTVLASGAAALALAPALARAAVDARALHKKLICIDTHLDMPANLARPGWNVMEKHSFNEDFTQVDYPRMIEGGLDGGFSAICTRKTRVRPEGTRPMCPDPLLRGM